MYRYTKKRTKNDRNQEHRNQKLLGVFIILTGALMLGFTLKDTLTSYSYIQTIGLVINYNEYETTYDGKPITLYGLMVDFIDPRTGRQYVSSTKEFYSRPEFTIGEEAPILFNPENPADYIVLNSFQNRYLYSMISVLLIIIGLGVIIRVMYITRKKMLVT